MRVLFVLDFFTPHVGGAETLFDNMTRKLSDKGVDVSILTQLLPGTKKFEMSHKRKIYRVYSPVRHAFAAAAAAKCLQLAKDADIVHAATLGGLASVALVGSLARKPVVATVFEVWGRLFMKLQKPPVSIVNYFAESVSLGYYKNLFCAAISGSTRNALIKKGFDRKKVFVVYPGIDKKLFGPKAATSSAAKRPTVLFFGRPGIAKGVNYLLRAMPIIRGKFPNVKLVLLLSKNPAGEYKKTVSMIAKLGLSENVDIIGPRTVKQLPGVIRSAGVCVVPSISEGFGFSAAEAVACGTPVVASDVGSLPEIIRHGYNGLLSDPAAPESIAKNVIKVLSDKNLRRRLSANGPKSVKRFDWDKAAESYLAMYRSALEWQTKWK
ncbi:MAG: glycosyltransferase family 4 protein [Candidatus Aenigmarchaeota archaeon]|nr:glycosyltransferase family 4 protein [Candidatus Aenigmarchaeota archaeon]